MPEYPRQVEPDAIAVTARRHGVVADGGIDCTVGLRRALDEARHASALGGPRRIELPAGPIKITEPIVIDSSLSNIQIVGSGAARASEGGTEIRYYGGSGALFQIGAPDGQPESANLYNGPQGVALENMSLHAYSGTLVPVAENMGAGSGYISGTKAVADYRGGGVRLSRLFMEQFETGFYGINSDFDRFYDLQIFYSKLGIYLGPRSDQFVGIGIYCALSERAMEIKGARAVNLVEPAFVQCGGSTKAPIWIHSDSAGISSDAVTLSTPWFELDSSEGGFAGTLPAWVEIGDDSATQTGAVVIDSPYLSSGRISAGSPSEVAALVKVGNTKAPTIVNNPTGEVANLSVALVSTIGTWAPVVDFVGANTTVGTYLVLSNPDGGTPKVNVVTRRGAFRLYRNTPLWVERNSGTGIDPTSVPTSTSMILDNADTVNSLSIVGADTSSCRVTFGKASDLSSGSVGYNNSTGDLEFSWRGGTRLRAGDAGLTLGGTPAALAPGAVGSAVSIANVVTAPTGTPTGGGCMYVEGGALKFKGSSGTVTTIAPA